MQRIFIIDDQIETTEIICKVLSKENYAALGFNNAIEAINEITKTPPDLVLLDMHMPEMDGFEAFKIIKDISPETKIVIITAYAGIEKSNFFLENGAVDFIAKPFNLKELRSIIARVLSGDDNADSDIKEKRINIIGESTQIRNCIDTAYKLSNSDVPIVIIGESGTGKELLADFIHYNSLRRYNNIVKINCAAIPKELLESELFGYEKGAFTGASTAKAGKLEKACKGTLFLDEICELDKELQAKLLRVLEDKHIERLGGTKTIETNFRLVCATNKNILDEVKNGSFRQDLYYRINTVTINVPPLRERKSDIEIIADYYIDEIKKNYLTAVNRISPEVKHALREYAWPGNVRELKNLIHNLVSLVPDTEIKLSDLPTCIIEEKGYEAENMLDLNLERMEKECISRALKLTSGNKKVSANMLGISEKTLYNKIERYKL